MSNIFEAQVEIDPLMTGWETSPVQIDTEGEVYLSWWRTAGDREIQIWANGILDEYTIGLHIEHLPSGDMLELDSWNDREQIDKILCGKLSLIRSEFEAACMEWLENGGDYDEEGEF